MLSDLSLSNLARLPGARVSSWAIELSVRVVTPLGGHYEVIMAVNVCLTYLGRCCRSPGTRFLASLWPRLRLAREERAERFTEDRAR